MTSALVHVAFWYALTLLASVTLITLEREAITLNVLLVKAALSAILLLSLAFPLLSPIAITFSALGPVHRLTGRLRESILLSLPVSILLSTFLPCVGLDSRALLLVGGVLLLLPPYEGERFGKDELIYLATTFTVYTAIFSAYLYRNALSMGSKLVILQWRAWSVNPTPYLCVNEPFTCLVRSLYLGGAVDASIAAGMLNLALVPFAALALRKWLGYPESILAALFFTGAWITGLFPPGILDLGEPWAISSVITLVTIYFLNDEGKLRLAGLLVGSFVGALYGPPFTLLFPIYLILTGSLGLKEGLVIAAISLLAGPSPMLLIPLSSLMKRTDVRSRIVPVMLLSTLYSLITGASLLAAGASLLAFFFSKRKSGLSLLGALTPLSEHSNLLAQASLAPSFGSLSRKAMAALLVFALIPFSAYVGLRFSRGEVKVDWRELSFLSRVRVEGDLVTVSDVSTFYSLLMRPKRVLNHVVLWNSSGPEPLIMLSGNFTPYLADRDLKALMNGNMTDKFLYRFTRGRFIQYRAPSLDPDSNYAVILPWDYSERVLALAVYMSIMGSLPRHTILYSNDPKVEVIKRALVIGPGAKNITVREPLPTSPDDLRWVMIKGNWSDGLRREGKGKALAILYREIDSGSYWARFCPEKPLRNGGFSLIFGWKNEYNYREFGLAVVDERPYLFYRNYVNGVMVDSYSVETKLERACAKLEVEVSKSGVRLRYANFERKVEGVKGGLLGISGWGDATFKVNGMVSGYHLVNSWPLERLKGHTFLDVHGVLSGDNVINLTSCMPKILLGEGCDFLKFSGVPSDLERRYNASLGMDFLIASVRGRLIRGWLGGPAPGTEVVIEAGSVRVVGGTGFYVLLSLRNGVYYQGNKVAKRALIMMRTPEIVAKSVLINSGEGVIRMGESRIRVLVADGGVIWEKLDEAG